MFRADMFKQHFQTLIPKIRELWPNVSEQDIKSTNGDVELLVKAVTQKYTIARDEILNKLSALLPAEGVAAGVAAGRETVGKK